MSEIPGKKVEQIPPGSLKTRLRAYSGRFTSVHRDYTPKNFYGFLVKVEE